VFSIFGSPRSGTTLLASIVSLHSQLYIPDETDFIVPVAFVIDRIRDPIAGKRVILDLIFNSNRFMRLRESISNGEIETAVMSADYSLYDIIDGIFRQISRVHGVKLAGDKSPNDIHYVWKLIKNGYFEHGIRVIHLVRDVRAVVESLQRMNWMNPLDPVEYARFWVFSNMLLHQYLKNRENYLLVKYEHLVKDPETEVRKICRHLDVPFEPQMLSNDRGWQYDTSTPQHKNLRSPITSEFIEMWQQRLHRDTIRQIDLIARDGLVTFGYADRRCFEFASLKQWIGRSRLVMKFGRFH
jgi:hypothetical protein